MPLGLTRLGLMSRAVRAGILSELGGNRIINNTHGGSNTPTPQPSGKLAVLWNGAKLVSGFLWGTVKAGMGIASFTWTAIWGMIVNVKQFLWNFNWNITDADLDKQVASAYQALFGIAGGLVGSAIGYTACGLIPAATIFCFNELAGAKVLFDVSAQMADELLGHLQMLIQSTFQSVGRHLFAETYKNIRKLLKHKNSFARKWFGDKAVDAWGTSGQPILSFSKNVEDRLDKVKNPAAKAFLSNLLEEADDACIEAGYVVANSMDEYLASTAIAQNHVLGNEHTIQITPSRTNPDEHLVIQGRSQLLQPVILQAMNTVQIIGNRDVGLLVGEELNEALRGLSPSLRIAITFYSRKTPPFYTRQGGTPTKRVVYTISNIDRTKLDWTKIKTACGGDNGYTWGRFRATANLSNNRQMQVHGATEAEAEKRLKALATLTSATITTLTIAEERKVGRRAAGQPLNMPSVQVYPAFFTVMNNIEVPLAQGGRPNLSGNRKIQKAKIELWHQTEPSDTKDRIREVLRIPGGVAQV